MGGLHSKKHYATSRPPSWMLQETAVHNLTNKVAIISNQDKGGSGKRSILSGNVSRNSYQPFKGEVGNVIKLDDQNPNFRYPNIRDRKRLEKPRPPRGGGVRFR